MFYFLKCDLAFFKQLKIIICLFIFHNYLYDYIMLYYIIYIYIYMLCYALDNSAIFS